jgi:predicted unusual protein kinase regulating ubiquinone biosynthesis (AarF/ABC1/UbiB family)
VEADLNQLQVLFALHRQMDKAIDTREIFKEIGARVREELDYGHEARNARLYADVLSGVPLVRVPGVHGDLSTGRLLTLDWLSGNKLLSYKGASQEARNRISEAMFTAWWLPFSRFGVIHGDPHLGNYTVFEEGGEPGGINLLDYGCIRLFPTRFIGGVVDLYQGLLTNDQARLVHAYETWGFRNLRKEVIEVLNIWARFIYGPILDDRVRTVADGVSPGEYGRKEAFKVHQELKTKGPVTVPQEFVFMDRAAIGLGGVFLHLEAKLNFYQLFNAAIENFSLDAVRQRQAAALDRAGLPVPT